MFIATVRPDEPSSVGARCDLPDKISLLRSLAHHFGPLVYKHFVPTGLRRAFQQAVFVTMDKNHSLTEHYLALIFRRVLLVCCRGTSPTVREGSMRIPAGSPP